MGAYFNIFKPKLKDMRRDFSLINDQCWLRMADSSRHIPSE